MINRFKPKSEFRRNVLTLMTGTSIAQAIPIVLSPILTHLYSPENFGTFALYLAIISVLSNITTGKYDMAIILPKKDSDAINIMFLAMTLSLIISVTILALTFIFEKHIIGVFNNQTLEAILYYIPISIFIFSINQTLNCWINRKKYYKKLAFSRIIQNSSIAGISLILGFLKLLNLGLILGQVIGQLISSIFLFQAICNKDRKNFYKIKKLKVLILAKKYVNFPKYLIFAHGINGLSQYSAIFLLSIFFNSATVGFFMLTQRVIGIPMSLIARSIADIFRQEASFKYANDKECKDIYLKTLKKLFLVATVPFSVFFIIAPELFAFVFGEEWRTSGEYARILTLMYYFEFLTTPLSNMFLIAEKQIIDLNWQICLFLLVALSFVIGGYIYKDIALSLILFNVAYSIMYTINLFLSFKFAKGNNKC